MHTQRNLLGHCGNQPGVLGYPDTSEGTAAGVAELPTRLQVEEKYKWRLEDMYTSQGEWDADAAQVAALSQDLAKYKGKLAESAESLLAALEIDDQMGEKLSRMYAFARMRRDEDNTHATYQALTDRATSILVQAESAKAFMVPEILEMPEARLREFITQNEELRLYEFVFDELLRQKQHILSEREEQLLAEVGEVASAPGQIFTMFNNADTRFPKIKDEQGNEVEVTHGRYVQFLESRNREVRKAAFDAVYSTYGKHRNTLAAIYATNVKKDIFYAKARGYESARAMALDSDNVPLSVYDNLIDAVHEAIPVLNKYMELRKRILNLDELHMYDLYTPIVPAVDIKIPYEEAMEKVKQAIAPLGSDYQRIASEGLNSGWVDVYETKGKTSGAYSWGSYGVHPYILLNYQNSVDNMFTLAHELGHAMHTYYSHEAQPYVYSGYTIFVAEVASTCNEALLTDYLLKTTEDKAMKAFLLNHHLETLRGTLFRQTMFAEFEKLAHQHAEEGGALTPEWLADTYYELNKEYYSSVCTVDEDIALEWSRIPHFYTSFYVYKYATGISASTALSQKILQEGREAVSHYLDFLKSGGSDYPINLLRKAGVDMESPEPVRAALARFGEMVDELSALLDS